MDKTLRKRGQLNRPQSKILRQSLRKNLTTPERQLWQRLRNKQLGVKFRRQHGIGPYIADFYCPECALVIELDGDSHFTDDAKQYDQQREKCMQTGGINTLRFTNNEIVENIEGVIQVICDKIHKK